LATFCSSFSLGFVRSVSDLCCEAGSLEHSPLQIAR
jgi:hypothetical protein